MDFINRYKYIILSALLLLAGYVTDSFFVGDSAQYLAFICFGVSYVLVGGPVWKSALKSLKGGVLFSEFFLMGIATIGAFILGEFIEGVAVMLFYMIGETVQHGAVHKARNSIRTLIDQQPDIARVKRDNSFKEVHPEEVKVGDIIQVRVGDKVPLDGLLQNKSAVLNTSALTGESKPMLKEKGEEIWAGSINQDNVIEIEVSRLFSNSRLAGILNMVEDATQRKAPTQRFMTRFARVYTPIVVLISVLITVLPAFFVAEYVFQEWFYKALVLLVISCPCGLVISIPLGYFGGIGAASQNGILFKGSDYLDRIRKMNMLFLDKTGTVTDGTFELISTITFNGHTKDESLRIAASAEQYSSHPIVKALSSKWKGDSFSEMTCVKELAGKGVRGELEDKQILLGNAGLLSDHGIIIHEPALSNASTQVLLAVENEHVATFYFGDTIKSETEKALTLLREKGVEKLVMLSGDNESIVREVGEILGFDEYYGALLPADKFRIVEQSLNTSQIVGFAGDGINDAPVVTLADVGIAMGGAGSDATVETADVVIQNDDLLKLPLAMDIAQTTHRIVWQNIVLALGIKVLVMILAFFGMANMWGAIFADVGVALLAIANAIRVQLSFSDQNISDFLLNKAESNHDHHKHDQHSCCGEC